jgi:hypothetical protein
MEVLYIPTIAKCWVRKYRLYWMKINLQADMTSLLMVPISEAVCTSIG